MTKDQPMRPRPKPVDKVLSAIRMANLRAIIDSCGGNRRVGDVVGWSAGFVSHLRTGCSPFTDRSARRIEAGFKLPAYWMDCAHSERSIPFGEAVAPAVVSTVQVLQAIADVASQQNMAPPLDRLSAVAILVAEDAANQKGEIDLARVKALIALSNLNS